MSAFVLRPASATTRDRLSAFRRHWRGRKKVVESDELKARIAPARKPVFEGFDGVEAVAFEDLVVAVVEQDDVAAADVPKALDDRRGAAREPIAPTDRPHDNAGPTVTADDAVEMRAAEAVGRAHPSRRRTDGRRDGAIAQIKFTINASGGQEGEIRVRVGVIGDGVPSSRDFARQRGERPDVLANQEERSAGFVTREER